LSGFVRDAWRGRYLSFDVVAGRAPRIRKWHTPIHAVAVRSTARLSAYLDFSRESEEWLVRRIINGQQRLFHPSAVPRTAPEYGSLARHTSDEGAAGVGTYEVVPGIAKGGRDSFVLWFERRQDQ